VGSNSVVVKPVPPGANPETGARPGKVLRGPGFQRQ